jgi:hypothetical protein
MAVKKQLPNYGGIITVQLFSSLKKTGLDEVWAKLDEWLSWESAVKLT